MFELNLHGTVLKDRYEIRGRISSGSYAEVFVACDRDGGSVVVIKALNSHLQGTYSRHSEDSSSRAAT